MQSLLQSLSISISFNKGLICSDRGQMLPASHSDLLHYYVQLSHRGLQPHQTWHWTVRPGDYFGKPQGKVRAPQEVGDSVYG